MNSKINSIFIQLAAKGLDIKKGLAAEKILSLETEYGITFPNDFKEYITYGIPVGKIDSLEFPRWDINPKMVIEESKLNLKNALEFDVRQNQFWPDYFGIKPKPLDESVNLANHKLELLPIMIPICGHRYMSTEPNLIQNPVFSLLQFTDVIVIANNLYEYFEIELNNVPHHVDIKQFRSSSWYEFL